MSKIIRQECENIINGEIIMDLQVLRIRIYQVIIIWVIRMIFDHEIIFQDQSMFILVGNGEILIKIYGDDYIYLHEMKLDKDLVQ